MAPFDKNDTVEKVIDTIVQELKVDRSAVNEGVTLEGLGADSLDIVQIIIKLEEQFGMEISDEDAEKMNSLSDIINYIQARRTK
jgi:acyl carrier protein